MISPLAHLLPNAPMAKKRPATGSFDTSWVRLLRMTMPAAENSRGTTLSMQLQAAQQMARRQLRTMAVHSHHYWALAKHKPGHPQR